MRRGYRRCLWTVAVLTSVLTMPRAGTCRVSDAQARQPQTAPPDAAAAAAAPGIRVLVDPRIELMCVVFRLAGHPEYSMGRIASYATDVDAHFAKFKDHAVVVRARQLRKTRGISFNAPMSLAVHVTNPPELAERVPFDPLPPGIDSRWTPSEARAFLADLRSFVRDTDAMAFLAKHANLYRATTERLESMVRERRIVEWLEGFFGRREDRAFVLVGALLNGGGNYGAFASHVTPSNTLPTAAGPTVEEIFSILGTESVDDDNLPSYPPRIASTVVHEFCHSYINPLVDAHESELRAGTEAIYPLVEEQMRSQAYGVPKAMTYESLVRACTVRYLSRHVSAEAAAREAAEDREAGFLWVGRLADTLAEYEQDRVKYPTLDAFVPRVAAFFDDYRRVVRQELSAVEAEKQARHEVLSANGPKVVSMSPANGAADVDAEGVTEITITFDRPMRRGNFALFPIPRATLPTLKGPPRFDATGRVVTLQCVLRPDTIHGFQLNSPQHMAFMDEQGNPLAPLVYRFTTRK